jgi:hypothetical protein
VSQAEGRRQAAVGFYTLNERLLDHRMLAHKGRDCDLPPV